MTQQIGDSDLLHTWGATGDVVEPTETKKDTGWEVGERPAVEYMNWVQNTLGQAINHVLKNGTPAWNSATEYEAGATVQHSGSVWVAKATNSNSQPSDPNSNWERILDLDELDARFEPQLQHNDSATTDPGATDDSDAGYSVRSNWINTNSGEVFRCIDATPGAAVWVKTTLTLDELGSAATADTGTSSGQVPLIGTPSATETVAGLLELLTQAEAEGGSDNERAATILRVAQYLDTQRQENGGDIWTQTSAPNANAIPSGTRLPFFQSSAPTGWTQVTSVNDRVLRVVSGAGGGTGGDWTISGLTHAHTHEHSHKHEQATRLYNTNDFFQVGSINNPGFGEGPSRSGQQFGTTEGTGSGSATTALTNTPDEATTSQPSTSAVSSDGNWRPSYINVIVAQKD